MMRKQVDRRLQRTRVLLQDALVAMIIEKGYEETTVQNIIDKANVGRATFYAHFADKETLLVSRLEDLRTLLKQQQLRTLQQAGESGVRALGFSLAMLEHAQSHWRLYQAMVGRRSGALILQKLQGILADLVRDDLDALGFKSARIPRDLVVQHITGSFMGVLMWWLESGSKLTAPEVDKRFRDLITDGLAVELKRQGQPKR